MLDEKDLQILTGLFEASEERMMGKVTGMFEASDERVERRIEAAEQRIMQSVSVLMESKFQPQFDLLVERQDAILNQLTPRSEIDDMKEEIRFPKSCIRQLNQEIENLKKAM